MSEQITMTFVTTMTGEKPMSNGQTRRGSRCVGYFADADRAVEAVLENWGDIYEMGYYPICVVETLSQGLYPQTKAIRWFEWDEKIEGYREMDERPEDLKRIVNFGLG